MFAQRVSSIVGKMPIISRAVCMRINNAVFGSLAVFFTFALAGCEDSTTGLLPTEATPGPGGLVASTGQQELVSNDGAPSIEELIAAYEEVAADPQLREVWSFGGTDGPMTVDEVLDQLYAARAGTALRPVAPASSDSVEVKCELIGNSMIGRTGGTPPGLRTILFRAVTVSYNTEGGNPAGCALLSIGGEGPIRLENNFGSPVHSSAMYFSRWLSDFASGERNYNYQGEQLRGFIDIRHWGTGFSDVYTGATASGL